MKTNHIGVSFLSLSLAAVCNAGHFTISNPYFLAPWTSTGNGTAAIVGDKATWSYSASVNLNGSRTSPTSANSSASVTAVVRWTITWVADAPGETPPIKTDAVLSVRGHAHTKVRAMNSASPPASLCTGDASITDSILGISTAAASSSGGPAEDEDGSASDSDFSDIVFDDAGGNAINLSDGVGYIVVSISNLAYASASYNAGRGSDGGVASEAGAYGELKVINIGGQSFAMKGSQNADATFAFRQDQHSSRILEKQVVFIDRRRWMGKA